MKSISNAPLPSSNPLTHSLSKVNLRQMVTKNGKFRVLGSASTYSTEQFAHYLRHAGVPSQVHTNSAYSVSIMTVLLRSEGFFCVVPPQDHAPTLHHWVDLVAYFQHARKLAAMGEKAKLNNSKSDQKCNDNDDNDDDTTTTTNTSKENYIDRGNGSRFRVPNWLELQPPESAMKAKCLEPDPILQPRRRVATMAISLYASWWLQHTAGYFRWIYPLALQEAEEKKRAIEQVKQRTKGSPMPVEHGSGTTAKKVGAVSDSVKAHARFFLLLDWGGYFVGKIMQTAMSKSLAQYGLKQEIHAFISQHLSDLCTILDAHFRIYRYLLATEEPMLADIMLASGLEFILKDDPPRSDIIDGSFRNLERYVAEVTGNTKRLEELEFLVHEEDTASLQTKRRKLKERHQQTQLFGFRNRDRQLQQEKQMLSKHNKLHHNNSNSNNNPNNTNIAAVEEGTTGGLQTVQIKQLTTEEDVVPETLAPFFALMEEVFPWLEAQRNSIEDRVNAFLETGSPLDVMQLPDIPSLNEFAGAKVPVVGKLPRLVEKAWEMEIDNPAGAEFSQLDRTAAEHMAAKSAGGHMSSVISCGTSMPHLHMTQFTAKDLEKVKIFNDDDDINDTHHQRRAAAAEEKRESSKPKTTSTGDKIVRDDDEDSDQLMSKIPKIPDEMMESLRRQVVQLKLEDPWDVAPQFEDRADSEYVIFRRQFLNEDDNVEVIDETKEGRKKRDREKKLQKKMERKERGVFGAGKKTFY